MIYQVAVGTPDGVNVTEHFGRCSRAAILTISQETGAITPLTYRALPDGAAQGEAAAGCGGGHDHQAVAAKIDALADCQIVLMARIGGQAEKQLIHRGIIPLQYEGRLEDALARIQSAYRSRVFDRRTISNEVNSHD
jgi:predicted Fe-Mo cluster-binding NifX family protein